LTTYHYLLLLATSFGGTWLALRFGRRYNNLLQISLSFTGAYVLGIAVLHLMPGVFADGDHQPGLWMLAGFFLQLLLEQFSQGVEHGHVHSIHGSGFRRTGFKVMLGLSVHAFLEGMPLAGYADFHAYVHGHAHAHGHDHLFWGVVLHKLPEAFSLALLLIISEVPKRWFWLAVTFLALMTPLGSWLVAWIDPQAAGIKVLIALVTGSLFHIATTIIFEQDNSSSHHLPWRKLLAIALGVGAAILTL